jgi:alpha-N-acetylglucosamine transferase
VIDSIPRTRYTIGIPGGQQSFWGYALNKLVVFNMTEFSKIIYVDADSLVLKNIDHLADAPSFTSSATSSCCNPGYPAAYSEYRKRDIDVLPVTKISFSTFTMQLRVASG